jgi:TonB family protein
MAHVRLLLLACACLLTAGAYTERNAQQPAAPAQSADTTRGIELYRQGDFNEAVALLRQASRQTPTDADAWHFLGLALAQSGKQTDALRALERAAYLRLARLSSFTVGNKNFDELTKDEHAVFRAEQTRRYQSALETLTAYLQFNPKDAPFWREQAESLQFYIAQSEHQDGHENVYPPGALTTRAVMLAKPNPDFVAQARNHGTKGEVVLRLVLAADGTVQHILALKPLPDGLTEASVAAARRIRFKPATKDGRPVSQIMTVSYNFNVR